MTTITTTAESLREAELVSVFNMAVQSKLKLLDILQFTVMDRDVSALTRHLLDVVFNPPDAHKVCR